MFTSENYQLLDFGDGRRLERFGEIVLDRPCPAAEAFERAESGLWRQADARFEGRDQQRGRWFCRGELPERWTLAHGALRFELKRTEFGHLGIFPEQAENWDWIARQCRMLASPISNSRGLTAPGEMPCDSNAFRGPLAPGYCNGDGVEKNAPNISPPKILNLFAYTGGSTLAAAAAGAEVVHVDAAKNVVAWARRNAELSNLTESPIRWIAEDAQKFVEREIRRGNRYDAVILDPPSYGHGSHGEVWRCSEHLPRLLDLCAELTAGRRRFLLLTCHTPGFDADALREMVVRIFGDGGSVVARPLAIRTATGRQLPSGVVMRWEEENAK